MLQKKFKLLRRTMFENDIDQITLAKAIGRSPGYFSERINGCSPFDANDMYKILDFFSIPCEQMHLIFPQDGLAKPDNKKIL